MGGTRYPRSKVDLGHGRGWLTKEAAASIRRIDRQIGHPLQITEAGRDWAQQNEHYQHYLKYGAPIALNPNTPSVHQKGDAVDSDEAQRILSIMTDHGWIRTVYRWVGGKWTLVERWHFEHFIERDNHRHDVEPAGKTEVEPEPKPIIEEDNMYAVLKREAVNEWTLAGADIGQDQTPTGFKTESIPGGVVNTYRGFMVTTVAAEGFSWGRMYCRPYGNAPLTLAGVDYMAAQNAARRVALATHPE